VEVGDTVITHTGKPRRVSAVHIQGLLDCVKITTGAGRSTIAALDHPFLTPSGWVQAGDLQVGMTLGAVASPQIIPSDSLRAAEARLLGYFVGDGGTTFTARGDGSFNSVITTASEAVHSEIIRCAESLGFTVKRVDSERTKAWRLNISGGARPWLKKHGLDGKTSHEKRVPEAVFTATKEVISEFIGGYFDCDGA